MCVSIIDPSPLQVRLVPRSLGWWQHYLPYRGIGHDPTPQGQLKSDNGGWQPPGSLHCWQRCFTNRWALH